MIVVLVLLGLAFTLAAPAFLLPRDEPEDAVQRVIDAARRAALHRAEAVTLSFEPDGRWVVEGGGERDSLRLLAGTLARPYSSPVRLRISPLGACVLDSARGPEPSLIIDPVRCRLSGG